ncbi:hypothetical protein CEXT_327201 [Caerostris extrusa]|uniref:Uncharacterized protein n=1 Tax=Caerostris extrusa TaxID=172846 RepID=A0AAV4XSA4_CAEEX|nr:hypothetical protein CEXT_327201 [Caerostris extrusa]
MLLNVQSVGQYCVPVPRFLQDKRSPIPLVGQNRVERRRRNNDGLSPSESDTIKRNCLKKNKKARSEFKHPIQWSSILEISLNFSHLAMWWSVWLKKKHLCALVGKLKFLEMELEYLDRKRLVKVSRAAVSCVIVLTCLYPILWLMRCMYFKRLNWPFELASVHDENSAKFEISTDWFLRTFHPCHLDGNDDSIRRLCSKATETFRLSLYEYIHLPGCFEGPFNRLMEDRKCLKLTAWGVFTINKSLFLGITTWIFYLLSCVASISLKTQWEPKHNE